ncbi:MAG: ribonuclease M5 [Tuberibacillus sp.]
MKIKEIIVVEGKFDTVAINRALEADTIETNGSAVSRSTLEAIKHAQETRGVIVFTDPDVPGERIRKIVNQYVPGCKHAFISKSEGFGGRNQSLGIEHASPESIRNALEHVYTEYDGPEETIERDTLVQTGLIGGKQAQSRRERLGEILRIGYTNGKQLYKRLNMFQITQETFQKAMERIIEEEQHGKHFNSKEHEGDFK